MDLQTWTYILVGTFALYIELHNLVACYID
jgi:hypothetical protein